MQDFNGEIDFSKLKKADFNPAQRLDLNSEIDFSKLKVAKNQPSFAGTPEANLNSGNLRANLGANLEANSAKKHPQNEQILANKNQNAQYIAPQNSANLNIYNLPKKASKSEQNLNAQGSSDEHSSYADKFSQAIQDGFNYLADNHENITAFASGAGKIYHDYAGGINKAIAKGLDNLAGDYANADFPRIANGLKASRDFFAQNANLAAQSSQILKEQMARGNNYAGVAGEILFDPMLAMPAGIITKGGKGALNTLKSIGAGASLGAGTSAIRDYNDDAISEEQMRQNAIINSAIWGGANGLLASKLIEQGARNLGHKIAPNKIDDYATAMAKKGGNLGANEANLGSANSKANLDASGANLEANPSANLRANPRMSEANLGANLNDANPRANLNPSAQNPNLGAKNPRASQRELEGSIDFSQLEKSDFTPNFTQENKIVGNGFVAKDGDLNYTDRVRFELGEYLKNNLNLNDNPLNASLNYLFNHHREMFNSRRDVLNSVKELLDSIPEVIKKREDGSYYLAKSITHTPTNRSSKMIDMTIEPQSNENYINHLNRGKYNKNMREAMDKIISDGKDAPLLTHQSELTGALSDNHSGLYSRSSPINGEILPQNADNFAQNLSQSAQNLSNANLNAPNLSGDLPNANLSAQNLPNANFHNPRAEFSANNAYENFSNPNNPRFMNGGGSENPRFMPYSASQNPRANARGQEERTGFLNGEHLGAKEASLMNGSVDFTHLKKADFPPNSSANLALKNSKDMLTWRAANGANVGENLKPNGANTARTNEVNQGANEAQNGANLGANEAQNGTTPHASETNSRMANLDANGANLGANEANLGSANSRANLGKRGKTLAHENGTSIHTNLDENSANSGASEINLDANPHTNSTNSRSANGANSNEANLPNADEANLNTNSTHANQGADEANLRARQEAQARAQQEAINEQGHLNALLDYAKSKENKARNFINSLLLRSTLGAGYGALANKDDRLIGAMIGAGAGAIGIPLLRALPHNFQTTVIKNALSGGVIGATSDSDNRVRGAMIGALAGAGGVPLALKVAEKLGAKANYNQNLREAMLDLHKNKGWRNIDDSFSGLVKRNFSDTLGGEYRELESQMNANINKQIYHLQDTFKSLSNLSENARREAHLYLSGELDKSVNLEPNLKAQLDNLRKSLDDNQRTLYELGRLERPAEADEITNSWLHRIYDKNKDGNFVFAGEAKTIEDIKTRGKVWKMDEEDFIKQINSGKIDVSLFNKPLYEGGIRATKTAQGKIELRRDWTFEERTKMGEIRDVAQTLPLSLIHQVRLIEQAKFLKAVLTLKVDGVDILKGAKEIENLKATFGEEEFKEVLKKQGFSQIPDDKKFGALRGRFVRSDIKDDLVGKFDSFRSNWSETAKVASDTWLQINKLMKKSKTIYNPVTHVNNIASNIAFLKMQGVSNLEITSGLKEYYSLMKKAPLYQDLRIKALQNQATSEDLARLNELKKEFGIYDSAQEVGLFGKSDLNDMSKETLFAKDNLIARSLNKTRIFGENSLISKSANKFDDWISNIYQGEDNVMRYVAFASHLKNGMSIKEAKLITNSLMPDYTKQIPFGIRVLRDSAISPFISWNYYVMPLLAKLSATPAGATHILGSFALLSGIGMSFNPTKSKDKPDRSFGAFVDIGKKGDTRTQLKVDRMLPQLQMVRPSSYASELLLQSPVLQAFSDAKSLLNGDTPTNLYFNKPITFKNKNTQSKALDYAKHFGQTYTPTPQAAWNLLEYMRALLQSENARRI